MATTKCVFIVFVLSLVISTVLCQTFQYSRGWTNGKRSEFSNSLGISNPGDEHFTNGEFKRLKMLVYGNVDEQPLLMYCDFVDNGKLRKLGHADNYASQLREKGQNDGNY
ncbi:Pro-corazonin [Trachymyrmex septentrionalis]|uniref:Pro-corazonin n=1 Tax=Trachymyrmex septentrionalis TaxID=34720 RepID=A0A195FM76_9HYME|nr:PREDICTED: pro-corazonin-like [Trachymyrmex septentrionalis]KYN41800.1 Pro-corazonin [Trachymyrmex septentrionalis]